MELRTRRRSALRLIGATLFMIAVAAGSYGCDANIPRGKVLFSKGVPTADSKCAPASTVTSVSATDPVYATYVFKSKPGSETLSLTVTKDGQSYVPKTGPGVIGSESGLTGAEAQQAMASVQAGATTDGYSVFSSSYLNRLSQTSNIALQASNNINLDLQGTTLSLASGKSLSLTAGNQITTNSTGTITTSNGNIALTGTNGIVFSNAFNLNSGGGNITLTGPTTLSAVLTVNSGTGNINITNPAGALNFTNALNASTTTGNVNLTAVTDIIESST